jgi:hypothetical protein
VIEVNGFRTYQGIVMLFMRVGICFSEFMFVKNSNPDNMPPPRPPPSKKPLQSNLTASSKQMGLFCGNQRNKIGNGLGVSD